MALNGCATTKTWDFRSRGGPRIIKVGEHISCNSKNNDMGEKRSRPAIGCYNPKTKTIEVRSDHPEVLLHELCHHYRYSRKYCAGIGWNK